MKKRSWLVSRNSQKKIHKGIMIIPNIPENLNPQFIKHINIIKPQWKLIAWYHVIFFLSQCLSVGITKYSSGFDIGVIRGLDHINIEPQGPLAEHPALPVRPWVHLAHARLARSPGNFRWTRQNVVLLASWPTPNHWECSCWQKYAWNMLKQTMFVWVYQKGWVLLIFPCNQLCDSRYFWNVFGGQNFCRSWSGLPHP